MRPIAAVKARRRRRAGTVSRGRLGGSHPHQRFASSRRNVERFSQYLTLVGLTALIVGGVGVANAVKSHLDRRRDVIATLKALGATGVHGVQNLSRCRSLRSH